MNCWITANHMRTTHVTGARARTQERAISTHHYSFFNAATIRFVRAFENSSKELNP